MTQVLFNANCQLVEEVAAHVMIVDPPYSPHVHRNATSQSPGRGTRHRDLGFDHLSDELRNKIAWFAAQMERWSLVYSDVEGLGAWREAVEKAGAKYIRPIPWVRWSMPQLSGDRPPTGCEMLTCYWGKQRGRKSWNGPGNLTHLAHKCLRGEDKHKAEKPLDQALDLVSWFSNEGETVFDPCMGHGTVGLACKILNRDYIGYEIDREWFEKAEARINGPLSERDQGRYERWLESQQAELVAKEKRRKNTTRVRDKVDSARIEVPSIEKV